MVDMTLAKEEGEEDLFAQAQEKHKRSIKQHTLSYTVVGWALGYFDDPCKSGG